MTLVSMIVAIVIVGVVLWAINTVVPLTNNVRNLLNIAVCVFLLFWLLQGFGLIGGDHLRLR